MAPSTRDIVFCALSISLGAYCMIADPSGYLPSVEPLIDSCSRNITPEEHASASGYHIYDAKFGLGVMRILVCIITQFLYELRQNSPAGTFTWMSTIAVSLPISVLMTIEAGRKDAKGLVRYPILMGLLYQNLGISIVVPLVWIPSWILGRGTGGVHMYRIYGSLPVLLPTLIMSILVFWLDPNTPLWTSIAAIIGGPGICFIPAVFWGVPDPDPKDPKVLKTSNERSSMVFAASGILALLCWLWLVFITTLPHYGLNFSAIYNDIWAQPATNSIKFMTMDAVVLWLAGLIILAYHHGLAALEGIALSTFFGPGAGLALVLAGLCVDDEAQLQLAEKTVEAKKAAKAEAERKKNE